MKLSKDISKFIVTHPSFEKGEDFELVIILKGLGTMHLARYSHVFEDLIDLSGDRISEHDIYAIVLDEITHVN